MDLMQVKVVVKAWEKAFRAKHARAPTKEDIKADGGGIADHYALYRRLSKAAAANAPSSSSSSRPPIPHASSSTASSQPASQSSSQAGPSRSTPRHIPANDYPTTPTPPARRRYTGASQGIASGSGTHGSLDQGVDQAGANKALKRKASATALESSPTTATGRSKAEKGETAIHAFLTPRKSAPRHTQPPSRDSGYIGPILDPHPSNPFSASPRKTPLKSAPLFASPARSCNSRGADSGIYSTGPIAPSPSKRTPATAQAGPSATSSSSSAWDANSPFIHATTPKKLKQVLAANSLRRVRARLDNGPGDGSGHGGDELDIVASPSKGKSPFGRMGRDLAPPPAPDITPRTKARKRLAGEMVTPTPGKAPRKRGVARSSSDTNGRDAPGDDMLRETAAKRGDKGKRAMLMNDVQMDAGDDVEGEEEGEDEFGPSPAKGLTRGFTSLIGEAISDDEDEGLSMSVIKTVERRTGRAGGTAEGADKSKGMGIFANRLAAATPTAPTITAAKAKIKIREQEGRDVKSGKRTKPSKMGMPKTIPSHITATPNDGEERVTREANETSDDSPFITQPLTPRTNAAATPSYIPASGAGPTENLEGQDEERLPTPPPDDPEPVLAEASQPPLARHTPSRPRRKVLSLSDDEVDEFDPEADRHKRVTIVPTRRIVRRRNSSDLDTLSDDEHRDIAYTLEQPGAIPTRSVKGADEDGQVEDEEEADEDVEMAAPSTPTAPSSTRLLTPPASSRPSNKKTHDIPPHLLSLLSLRSPVRPRSKTSGALADLRARAIFDEEARRELRAIEKGQEVRVAGGSDVSSRVGGGHAVLGRGGGEGDEEEERLLMLYGARRDTLGRLDDAEGRHGEEDDEEEDGDTGRGEDGETRNGDGEGDDDWDSESEGWKRTGEDMDDW